MVPTVLCRGTQAEGDDPYGMVCLHARHRVPHEDRRQGQLEQHVTTLSRLQLCCMVPEESRT